LPRIGLGHVLGCRIGPSFLRVCVELSRVACLLRIGRGLCSWVSLYSFEIPVHVPMHITEHLRLTEVLPTEYLSTSKYFLLGEPTKHNAHTEATIRALRRLIYRSSSSKQTMLKTRPQLGLLRQLSNDSSSSMNRSTIQSLFFLQTNNPQTPANKKWLLPRQSFHRSSSADM
jgi:hypothetical protein